MSAELPTQNPVALDRSAPAAIGPGRVAVAIIHYRTYDELPGCLAALERQQHAPEAVVVIDADGDPEARAPLAAAWPDVRFEAHPNRGYAGGANSAVRWAAEAAPEAEYLLLLNPDVELEPGFLGALATALDEEPKAALACGKTLRADGVTIDGAGITLPRHRRPRDRGSGERDEGQYDRRERVFGASGAAMMIRRAAIPALELEGELFDEDFFVYHEDTDLSWRCHRLGWDVLYVPEARAIHGRRWKKEARFRMPVSVRRHSFKNHYLQLVKNERAWDFVINAPILLGWEVLRLGFAALRDPGILPAYLEAARLLGPAWRKRRALAARAALVAGGPS